jgi:DNA-directed RNA polymerase subunit M/transcription elongation factor TFIIS
MTTHHRSSLKRLAVPPPPLHEKLGIEGRWRTVRLLQSLHPTQDPVQIEKFLFLQCQGDGNQYEAGVYRVCAALHLKRDIVAAYTPGQLVATLEQLLTNDSKPLTDVIKPSPLLTPKTVECQIRCGRCKSTQVSVEQKQTRGADESMTVFVQCEKCGLRWKM